MTKRVLIVIGNFSHGGTNKSLTNLLNFIDKTEFNIEIFCGLHKGPYKLVLKDYKVLKENQLLSLFLDNYKKEKMIRRFMILLLILIQKTFAVFGFDLFLRVMNTTAKNLSKKKYDTILAFSEGFSSKLVSLIPTSKKIAWVRSDYKRYLEISKLEPEMEIYQKFMHIICVSEYTAKNFKTLLPSFKHKVLTIHNIIDFNSIIKKSEQLDKIDERFITDEFTIISIGRLDPVKRFSEIPRIAKEILLLGGRFKWYIIGAGSSSENAIFNENLRKFNVMDNVINLGEKSNPYPYIKLSNLLVSTSISEACPNSINEAKILHTPIVTANYGSSYEFINSSFGIISEFNNISKQIFYMITNNEGIYTKIEESIKSFHYTNKEQLSKLNNIL